MLAATHLRLEGRGAPVAEHAGFGEPQRMRRRPQAEPALADNPGCRSAKSVGEPCAAEPHVRFDGRALETDTTGRRREQRSRKADGRRPRTYGTAPLPRQRPTQALTRSREVVAPRAVARDDGRHTRPTSLRKVPVGPATVPATRRLPRRRGRATTESHTTATTSRTPRPLLRRTARHQPLTSPTADVRHRDWQHRRECLTARRMHHRRRSR